jgi:hypothetical protein
MESDTSRVTLDAHTITQELSLWTRAMAAYASHVPSREAALGFLFGVAVIAAGVVFDLLRVSSALILLIFGGWIFFSIRDRRKSSS